MSGGDFLFIFSFIILPTAILVSTIWALIALRMGVLLPPRPPMDLDAEYDVSDESLDEHVPVRPQRPGTDRAAVTTVSAVPASIESTVPRTMSPAGDALVAAPASVADVEYVASSPVAPEAVRHDIVDAPTEQTLEMDALEVTEVDARSADAARVQVAAPDVTVNTLEADAVSETPLPPTLTAPSVADRPPTASPSSLQTVSDDLDVVFIPGNRSVAAPVLTPDRERPDGTEPIAVQRMHAAESEEAVVADDLTAITPDEAPSDAALPSTSTSPARTDRRGGRSLARRRQAAGQEPRQRILVSPPSRRNARAGRPGEESVSRPGRRPDAAR